MRHVVVLGAVGVIVAAVGAVATWNAEPAFGTKWYPLLLIVTALLCVWIGGILRATPRGEAADSLTRVSASLTPKCTRASFYDQPVANCRSTSDSMMSPVVRPGTSGDWYLGITARCVTLFGALCLLEPTAVEAQARERPINDAAAQGVLPEVSFDATLRKYSPPQNVFSPYYSWDAQMALNLTAVRRASSAVNVSTMFQTVGTRNLGSEVSVGGTGYLLGLHYVHTYSDGFNLSSGLVHFSSHLTRDLDDKIDEERAKGAAVPVVDDPSEFNVIYFKGHWKLRGLLFAPELKLVVQPINFRFDGSQADYVRPIYFGTGWTLWQSDQKLLTAETQQEIGHNPFINLSLVFAVGARNQPQGRFQIFVTGSPGDSVHVSPQIGALRDGIAFGFRLKFSSEAP